MYTDKTKIDGLPITMQRRIVDDTVLPNWHYQFQLPGKSSPICRTTKIPDLNAAKKIAIDAYYELTRRVEREQPLNSISFEALCDQFVGQRMSGFKKHNHDYYRGTIERYLRPLFQPRIADI